MTTIGWAPSCACPPADPIPCTVLDLFAGSGTTLAVAVGLGRHAIGIELNASYIAVAEAHVRCGAAAFIVSAEYEAVIGNEYLAAL